jgi:ketosteroid isomerase-like protein
MRQHGRKWTAVTSLALVATLLVGAFFAYGLRASAAGSPPAQAERPDQEVVTYYFEVVNAGVLSGDFSELSEVYAPDATLTQSNPKGVTIVAQGLDAIIAWYQGLRARFPGIQFTQEQMRSLAPHVVISYERALPAGWVAPGRCMHVFALKEGKIISTDWATYYGGQQV